MPEIIRQITIKVMKPDEDIECISVEETELLRLLKVKNPNQCEVVDAEITDYEECSFS